MNEKAVALIQDACRIKFSTPRAPSEEPIILTDDQLSAVTGNAAFKYGDVFGGSFYNGNRDLTVTFVELEISLTDGRQRSFLTEVYVRPLRTADFSVRVGDGMVGTLSSWSVLNAKGVPDTSLASIPSRGRQRLERAARHEAFLDSVSSVGIVLDDSTKWSIRRGLYPLWLIDSLRAMGSRTRDG